MNLKNPQILQNIKHLTQPKQWLAKCSFNLKLHFFLFVWGFVVVGFFGFVLYFGAGACPSTSCLFTAKAAVSSKWSRVFVLHCLGTCNHLQNSSSGEDFSQWFMFISVAFLLLRIWLCRLLMGFARKWRRRSSRNTSNSLSVVTGDRIAVIPLCWQINKGNPSALSYNSL